MGMASGNLLLCGAVWPKTLPQPSNKPIDPARKPCLMSFSLRRSCRDVSSNYREFHRHADWIEQIASASRIEVGDGTEAAFSAQPE
jgi:hypothetical protein